MKITAYGCAFTGLLMTSLSASGLAADDRDKAANTACCPGTDNTVNLQESGLGQQHPAAANVSSDPRWLVYRFGRDGIEYLQINDLAGRVHLIIGKAGDQFWRLPAGDAAARVSLPLQRLPVPERARRSEVYLGPEFSLVHFGGNGVQWAVEVPGAESDPEGAAITACCPGDDHHLEIQALPSAVE